MLELLERIFGLAVKKRIEEVPAVMVIEVANIELKGGLLRIPFRIDFPPEK